MPGSFSTGFSAGFGAPPAKAIPAFTLRCVASARSVMAVGTIIIGTPTATAGSVFNVSGILRNTGPKLSYQDDPVLSSIKPVRGTPAPKQISLSWTSAAFSTSPLPTGAVVTSSAFSFTHPPLSAGEHSIAITDGTVEAITRFAVRFPPQRSVTTPTPLVVDMSHWNSDPSSAADLLKSGVVGIIHKATQGTDFTDGTYATRRAMAANAGLLWGAYHYLAAGNVAEQAAYFLAVTKPDANTLIAVDYEDPTVPIADLREFCAAVTSSAPGQQLVIYSNNVVQEQLAGNGDPGLGKYRLWHAEVTDGTPKWDTATWPSFWIWQYGTALLPGMTASVDVSTYIGSREGLASDWVGGGNQAMAYT